MRKQKTVSALFILVNLLLSFSSLGQNAKDTSLFKFQIRVSKAQFKVGETIPIQGLMCLDKSGTSRVVIQPFFNPFEHRVCNTVTLILTDSAGNKFSKIVSEHYEPNPTEIQPNFHRTKCNTDPNNQFPQAVLLEPGDTLKSQFKLPFEKLTSMNQGYESDVNGKKTKLNSLPAGKYKVVAYYRFSKKECQQCWPTRYTDNWGKPWINAWEYQVSSNELIIQIY